MIAARGRFDAALLGAAMTAHGMTKTSLGGIEAYEAPGNALIAFPETGIIVAGDSALVRPALARRTQPLNLDASLLAKVNSAGSRNDVWFVATGVTSMNFGKMALPADTLEVVSGGLLLGSTVELSAEAVMKTEKDAQALAQMIQFMIAMGDQIQGDRGQANPFLPLLQGAKSSVQGTSVLFSLTAAQSDLEKLFVGRTQRVAQARQ
jgi:hypothetical protein